MAYQSYIAYWVPSGADAATRESKQVVVAMHRMKDYIDAYAVHSEKVAEAVARYGAGAMAVPASLVDIPPWALAGFCWYNINDGEIQRTPVAAFPGREAVRDVHERYDELYFELHRLGPRYPPDDVLALDRLLYRAHGGVFTVFNEDDLTAANKLTWLAANALGPSDLGYDREDPKTIAPIIAAIPAAQRILQGAVFFASPGPQVITGAAALGTRYTLAQTFTAARQTATMPTEAQLRGGEWIDDIMF